MILIKVAPLEQTQEGQYVELTWRHKDGEEEVERRHVRTQADRDLLLAEIEVHGTLSTFLKFK